MILRFNAFGRRNSFAFTSLKQKTETINGYTNRTKDGLYCVFIDYDDLELKWVMQEIERLQKDYRLSTFYILESSPGNFHAVCFDKLSLGEYLTVLRNSSVDPRYMDVPLKHGKKIWTLRATGKNSEIHYKCKIPGDNWRQQSRAHQILLSKIFEFDIYKHDLENSDEYQDVILAKYEV